MMPGQVGSNPFPVGGLEPVMSATEQAEQKFSALMAALLAGAGLPGMIPVEPEQPVLLPETPPGMSEAPPSDPVPSPVSTVGMTPVDPQLIVEDQMPTDAEIAPGCGSPVEPAVAEASAEEDAAAAIPAGADAPEDESASMTPAPSGDLPTLFHAAYAVMAQLKAAAAAHGPSSSSPDANRPAPTNPGMSDTRPSAKPHASPADAETPAPGGVALDGLEALVEDLDIKSAMTRSASVAPKPEPQATAAQDVVSTPQPEQPRPDTVAQKVVSEIAPRFSVETERPQSKTRHETTATSPAEPSLYGTAMPGNADRGAIPEPVEVRPAPMAQEPTRQPTPTDRVTLHLPDDAGGTRIQIAVRGETVHTRIVAGDPAAAGGLEQGIGDLRDALARQGFQDQQVRVESRPQGAEPRAAVDAGWAPAASRDSAGANNERRQESDAREDARRPDPREQQQHRSPNRDRRGRER